jgi:hypothetical protein
MLDTTTLKGFTEVDDGEFGLAESGLCKPPIERTLAAVADDGTQIKAPRHKAIVVGGEVVGVVGSRYQLLPNVEFFGALEDAIRSTVPEDLLEGAATRSWMRDGFSNREYVLPAYASEIADTSVGLRVIARNSYNGAQSAKVTVGLIDFYCTNGMITGREINSQFKRHSAGLTVTPFVDLLRRGIENINDEIDWISQMHSTPLSMERATAYIDKNFNGPTAAGMMSQFEQERNERGENVFALHSALTYWSSHDSSLFPIQGNPTTVMMGREERVQKLMSAKDFRELVTQD